MNGENNAGRSKLASAAVYVIGFLLSMGVYTLGLVLREQFGHGKLITFLFMGLLILSTAGSGIGSLVYARWAKSRSVAQHNEQADERLARMKENPEGEWAKLRTLCILGYGYVIFLWFLCLGTIFFYGTSGLGTEWIALDLIPLFFLFGLLGKLIHPREKPDRSDVLEEERFPLLYSLARSAAGDNLDGRKLTIRILDDIPNQECNAALVVNDQEVCLWLGTMLLCILDEGELKQVFLHEFGHMEKNDMSENRMYNKLMAYLTEDCGIILGGLCEIALSLAGGILYQEGSLYFLFSSRLKENRADHQAAEGGDREKQASALAKIGAHTLYIYESEPYDNIFLSQEIPQHLLTDRARAFREALLHRGAFWKSVLEHEIPSRVDTHPTFRQRWEALGCCEYDLTPSETESAFARECWKAAETGDFLRASISQERYEQMRKESYLDEMDIIDRFETAPSDLSPDSLREPMLAYYKVGKPEKMEAICDQILQEYDSPFATAFASYWKGVLLLHRYDRAGLDYVYRAMDANTNYIESGLDEIGTFCTRMGLQEDLDAYRTRAPELMQTKVDRNVTGIHSRAKLTKADLPEGWLDKILSFTQKNAGEDLEAVYLVKELAAEDYAPSSFVLRFRESTPDKRIDEVYERVFRLLDDWPEDYEFCLYVYEASMEKALAKVDGSCIYHN